jgi:hypothetical protein
MKTFLKIASMPVIIAGMLILSGLSAQAKPAAPNVLISPQKPEVLKKPSLMTEETVGYYQLMTSGTRALSKEEALRLFNKAKQRQPARENSELSKAADEAIENVDRINFAANRKALADNMERGVPYMKSVGRLDDARELQRRADRVRSGEATGIYDAMNATLP